MSTCITRHRSNRKFKTHAVNQNGKPLCGGGHKAAQALEFHGWQSDLAEPTCGKCLLIQAEEKERLAIWRMAESLTTAAEALEELIWRRRWNRAYLLAADMHCSLGDIAAQVRNRIRNQKSEISNPPPPPATGV